MAGIVLNPSKFDEVETVKARAESVADALGWTVRWWETTVEDSGYGQAREALAAGVDVVCALGGDGTVREVAAALVDSGIPMGLLPAGTGNLLARNLDLPIDSLDECLAIALRGSDHRIDVGRLTVTPADRTAEPTESTFLVMAGIGFDASVMAQAEDHLKAHLGWLAYVVSGLKQLDGPRFDARLALDSSRTFRRRVRSVIIGNVGRLQGGVELMPDAEADDGNLDVVVLAPKGIVGWAAVSVRILTKTRRGHHRVEHLACRTIAIAVDSPQEVQVDGDPLGQAVAVRAAVVPDCLTVRVDSRRAPSLRFGNH